MNYIKKYSVLFLLMVILGGAVPDLLQAQSNLPLPRFVSMKSSEANMRTGPGLRYQIRWVMKRKHIPVEIIGEYEQWREVRDIQGDKGWVHRSMLSGRRSAIVAGDEQVVYRSSDIESTPIARLEKGVVGRLLECNKDMCRIRVDGYKGWVKRSSLWGIYSEETLG